MITTNVENALGINYTGVVFFSVEGSGRDKVLKRILKEGILEYKIAYTADAENLNEWNAPYRRFCNKYEKRLPDEEIRKQTYLERIEPIRKVCVRAVLKEDMLTYLRMIYGKEKNLSKAFVEFIKENFIKKITTVKVDDMIIDLDSFGNYMYSIDRLCLSSKDFILK